VGGYTDIVGVWDISAVGLMRFLKLLNEGVDWTGKPIAGQADFFIGASCDPNAEPLEPQLRLMRRKAEAGAHFFVTQNVFDEKVLERFLEKTNRFGLPVIVAAAQLPPRGVPPQGGAGDEHPRRGPRADAPRRRGARPRRRPSHGARLPRLLP
jgi:hypothetical protein